MPVTPTYPGVYIQEVPSGVRTIVGVSTAVAVFLGRAKQGPLNKPIQCLNYSDFERAFSGAYAGSDMARAVRLFFQNGGTQCYAMRIANGATPSEVTLKSEARTEVLKAKAKSAGSVGDTIRLAVNYAGLNPESAFNLMVFRWGRNERGEVVQQDTEVWQNLTMEPKTPRYAVDYVNQNSSLIKLEDKNQPPPTQGYSQSGRAVPSRTNANFRDKWIALIGPLSKTNKFRIRVDGGEFVDVDFSGIDFGQNPLETAIKARNNLAGELQAAINNKLIGGAQVIVTFEAGPSGPSGEDNENTVMLRIASAKGDVQVEPATGDGDLAGPLMLGTSQGGIELSRYAQNRPAPNGVVFKIADLNAFAELEQTAFTDFTINGTSIPLGSSLQTADPATVTEPRMYQDNFSPTTTDNSDGVREKWAIIADEINKKRADDPTFKWSAELWGSRLALLPGEGAENSQGTVSTSGGDDENISGRFSANVRYYSLGPSGQGNFQTPAGAPASDGGPPELIDYRNAFKVLDKEVDLFNLMILPADAGHSSATTASLWGLASIFCQQRRAFLLMDAPPWKNVQEATKADTGVNSLRRGLVKDHSAIFYPRITIVENGLRVKIGPSGAMAGLMARIDGSRGVWKAPAGLEADLRGVQGLEHKLSDPENGVLNPRAINTLRIFPSGVVNWGARTMDGDDDFGSEYKYIPVRRLALFLEESLYRGTQWVVFEPNDEPLWALIRLNVGAFLHSLFRQGAFAGQTPQEAYFVKCDKETTTQDDINRGIVNIVVGFAPLKPAEFVIIRIQQIARAEAA